MFPPGLEQTFGAVAHPRSGRLRRARQLPPAPRPARSDRVVAVALVRRQVDDGRRRAGQLAAVELQVDLARGCRASTSSSRRASAPPRRVRARLEDGPAHRGQRRERRRSSGGTRTPSRSGVGPARRAGSAAPGSARAAVTAPGSSRSSASRVRGAELGQRGQRQLALEEHHRRRAAPAGGPSARRAARRPRASRARWPARRPCRPGTAPTPPTASAALEAWRRPRASRHAPDRHALAARRGRGRVSASRSSARTAAAWSGRVLERHAQAGRRPGHQRADRVEPVGAGHQRHARLVVARSRARARPTRPRARTAGSRPPGRSRPRGQARRCSTSIGTSSPSAPRSRARRRPRRRRRPTRSPRRSGRSSRERERDRPAARAHVVHARAVRGSSSATSTSVSVSGRGISTRGSTRQLDVAEAAPADDVGDRLARARRRTSSSNAARPAPRCRRRAPACSRSGRRPARAPAAARRRAAAVSQPAAPSASAAASTASRTVPTAWPGVSPSRARSTRACGASRRPRARR